MKSKSTETESSATSGKAAGMIRGAGRHVSLDEGLIFEKSAPGKRGMEIPPLDVPAVDPIAALGREYARGPVENFPEVSEIEVVRHFT
ncbi:MAG: hypothetical protein WB716_12110, partial [Candidatus Acidiferrales bacterium]